MSEVCGIVVKKENGSFSWKLGAQLWQFRQWPEQRLHRNGIDFSMEALQQGLKLIEDAVRFSIGFESGFSYRAYSLVEGVLEA